MVRWHSFADGVEKALDDPELRAVLEVSAKTVASTLANDVDVFISHNAPECIVNNPAGMVVPGSAAADLMRKGLIHYDSFDRRVEYAGKHAGMVVVMGEETVVPKAPNPLAGKTVRRRFTDLWREIDGEWKLSARQATIVSQT